MKTTKTLIRIYPGVRPDQKAFILKESKKLGKGHGETVRHIIDTYKQNNK